MVTRLQPLGEVGSMVCGCVRWKGREQDWRCSSMEHSPPEFSHTIIDQLQGDHAFAMSKFQVYIISCTFAHWRRILHGYCTAHAALDFAYRTFSSTPLDNRVGELQWAQAMPATFVIWNILTSWPNWTRSNGCSCRNLSKTHGQQWPTILSLYRF